MRNITMWLAQYEASHRHPLNILIHKIFVPLIFFSILGMLYCIPNSFGESSFLNFTVLASVLVLIYYASLSLRLAAGIAIPIFLSFGVFALLEKMLGGATLYLYLTIFVVSWIFQFIGHHYEGKKPSFFKNVHFLLIGPLWTLNYLYKKLNLKN